MKYRYLSQAIIQEEFRLKEKRITVEQVCVHDVVAIEHDMQLVQCAKIMHDAQIGSLIVTEVRNGLSIPVGILTDRDIAVKVVAFSLDPDLFTARDIMAQPIVTAQPKEYLRPVLARMRTNSVHRVAVVSDDGALVGILAVDDIWENLLEDVDSLERILLAKKSKMALTSPLACSGGSLVQADLE
jgi:CBS domain-containing protein